MNKNDKMRCSGCQTYCHDKVGDLVEVLMHHLALGKPTPTSFATWQWLTQLIDIVDGFLVIICKRDGIVLIRKRYEKDKMKT